ncbi:ABC transporter permease [Stackebrandtia soli]|uniref:ABC transporter permease n=1 Tax=Stackebrandtia soli TaxID=1892856 RepID=UPI0039ECDD38
MSMPSHSAHGAGVIHNIGYRRYTGPRLGRRHIAGALYSQTLQGSFGIGRGMGAKLFPWFLIGCMMLPAFILVAVTSQTKATAVELNAYTMMLSAIPILFIAVQAPQAVSRDLRFGTLSLYFSRPLAHGDYVGAKIAGSFTALFAVMAAPLVLLYVGELLISAPFFSTTLDLLKSMVAVAILALMFVVIGLLIASVTPRRGLGVAAIIAVLSGSFGVANVLQSMAEVFDADPHLLSIVSPVSMYDTIQSFLFGYPPSIGVEEPSFGAGITVTLTAVAIIALCGWLLNLRYRKVASA